MQSFRWRRPGRPPLPPRGAQGAAATHLQPELLAHPRILAPQQPLARLNRNPARQAPGLAAGPAEPRARPGRPAESRPCQHLGGGGASFEAVARPCRDLRGEAHGAGLTWEAPTV